MADINIVAENLAELLTNTVDMAAVFYDIFLNPQPMDINIQMFDDNNQLITVTIPNRAKDRITPYVGEGSPEGVIEAPVGSTYVDTLTSTVYYKVSGSDSYGWNAVISQSLMETFIRTYLEARGYITTSSLNTYLITHEYVDIPTLSTYLNENGYIRGKGLVDLPTLALNNKLMVVTDDETDFFKNVSFGNLLTSSISSDADNGIVRGADSKLYVDNADSGVTAGTYEYPVNLIVNSKGKVTSVESGTVASDSEFGVVKTDNTTIIANNGVISASLSEILGAIYPVDSIYITTSSSETCPIASLITGSTWSKVGAGRVLQGADSNHNPNTTIAAGLPNITGTFQAARDHNSSDTATGAFYGASEGSAVSNSGDNDWKVGINASRSSSIYGNSTTVQPPAYVVVIWRRTA